MPAVRDQNFLRIAFFHLQNKQYEEAYRFQGDSGGPLIVQQDGRWMLAGITSAGFGCAVDHQPGIYHKVADTAGWIAAHINS